MQQRRVLVIDDSPEDRVTIRRYLSQDSECEYSFVEAARGDEGLALWREHAPDCVLLDYHLPDMDGLALLRAARRERDVGDCPVVMLTGSGTTDVAVAAMKSGAQDFITKDRLLAVELQRAVNNAVEKVTLSRQLDRQREWTRVTLASIGDAIIATDTEGRVSFMNEVAQSLTGWGEGEAAGRPLPEVFRIVNEFSRAAVDNPVTRVLKEGVVVGLANHTLLLAKDGREIPIDDSGAPIKDDRGRVLGAVLIFRDITERRRAEAAQRRSEARAKRLAEANVVGVLEADFAGNVTEANDAFLRMVGYTRAELLAGNVSWLKLTPQEFLPRDEEAIAELRARGMCAPYEKEYLHKDGRRVPLLLGVARYEDSADTCVAFAVDLTERKRVEAELSASEERFRTSVENMLDCFGIYTSMRGERGEVTDFRIEYVNSAACANNFMSSEEQVGKGLCEILPAHRASGLFDEFRRVVETGEPLNKEDLIYEDDYSGRRLKRAFDIRATKLGDGFAAAWRDVTDRRLMEEERELLLAREQKARAEAEAANRTKDEFLATLSHELRTPLTAMLGWARMLRSGGLDEAMMARALEVIERNAVAQQQLIEDLLDVSRIITGKVQLDAKELDLHSVLGEALESVRVAADAKGIELTSTLDETTGPVLGDPARLQQVAWNLLSNAIKFTPRSGQVAVRLERSASNALITVADTGQGIAPEFLPHVFDRFRQADSSTDRRHGGLGLGLAIVRHLIELHGGAVSADSPGEGRGSRFTISLPLRAARAEEHPASAHQTTRRKVAPAKTASRLEGLHILVVDDEPDTRELLHVVLTQNGAEVTTAASSAEALSYVAAHRPDAILCDIGMPDGNGYQFVGKLRTMEHERAEAALPAIALTAYARDEDRSRALAAGFDLHLPKPVDPDDLVATVLGVISGKGR